MIKVNKKFLSIFLFLLITLITCSAISAANPSDIDTADFISDTSITHIETAQDLSNNQITTDNTEINNIGNEIKKTKDVQSVKKAASVPTETTIDRINNQKNNTVSVYAGESVSVSTATIDAEYGDDIEGELTIQLLQDDTVVATGTNFYGTGTLKYTPEVAGTYNLKVKALEDDYYQESTSKAKTLIVNLRPTTLTAQSATTNINENIEIPITLIDTLNNTTPTKGNVIISTRENPEIENINLETDQLIFTPDVTKAGQTTYTLTYTDFSNKYDVSSQEITVTVNGEIEKTPVTIQADNVTAKTGSEIIIPITLIETSSQNQVTTGTITVKKDEETITTIDVENDELQFTLDSTEETQTEYIITYTDASGKYETAETTITVTIESMRPVRLSFTYPTPLYLTQDETIIITVTDPLNNTRKVSTGSVELFANNISQGTKDVNQNGRVEFTYMAKTTEPVILTATFSGNENYLTNTSKEHVLNVQGYDSRISIKNISSEKINLGQQVSVNVTVEDAEYGWQINEGTVDLLVDNEIVASENVQNNKATLTWTPETVGNYTIKARFNGNDIFEPSTTTKTKTVEVIEAVELKDTRVMFSYYNPVTVDEEVEIKAYLVNKTSSRIKEVGLKLTVFIDDEELAVGTTDSEGYAYVTYIPEKVGQVKVKVVFNGTDEYEASEYTSLNYLIIEGKTVKITYQHYNPVTVGENVEIRASVIDDKGKIIKLAGEELTLYVDGQLQGSQLIDENGVASFVYVPEKVGQSKITVYYAGNDQFKSLNYTGLGTLNVEGKTVRIGYSHYNPVYVGENVEIKAYLMDEKGQRIKESGNDLTLYVDGTEISTETTDADGYAIFTYVPEKIGNYTTAVNYNGSEVYAPLNYTGLGKLNVQGQTVRIGYMYYNPVKIGEEVEIKAYLMNEKGQRIKEADNILTLYINNTLIGDAATDADGYAYFTYTAEAVGNYTTAVNYNGSEVYAPLNYTGLGKLRVEKIGTKLVLNIPETVKKGENVTITGSLADENNKILSNSVVKLLINNGRKTLKTDENGVFTFVYTMSRIGQNNITATFLGNDIYEEVQATKNIEVKALATIISFDKIEKAARGSNVTFTGKLTDENGNAIANTQVKLTINGSPKTLKTDSDGRFTHSYIMNKMGENNITVTYDGSTSYEASNTEMSLEVTKAEAIINLDSIDNVTKGSNVTFTGKLTDVNGKGIANAQIKITINGSPKTLKTDENGIFTHTFKMIKEGTNNITVIFNENNYYTTTSINSTVEVIKHNESKKNE